MLVHLDGLPRGPGQDSALRPHDDSVTEARRNPENPLGIGYRDCGSLALLERQATYLLRGLRVEPAAQVGKRPVGDHNDLVRLERPNVVRTADEPHGHRCDGNDGKRDSGTIVHALRDSTSQPGSHDSRERYGHCKEHRVNHP